jgi:hypothetical protein
MDPRISILTFPQAFDGDRLHLSILLVPRLSTVWSGNPLLPLIEDFPNAGDTTPAFADADFRFELRALDGLGTFPVSAPVSFTTGLPDADGVQGDARALFEALVAPGAGRFKLSANPPRLAEPVKKEIFIQKYLPRTYRNAFLFTGPRTEDARTDDSYHCAVKAQKPLNPAFVPSPDEVSWGEVYAFCLRNARLAQALGLIRQASFQLQGTLFGKGVRPTGGRGFRFSEALRGAHSRFGAGHGAARFCSGTFPGVERGPGSGPAQGQLRPGLH